MFPSTWLDGLADVDRETSNPRPLSIKGFDAYFSATNSRLSPLALIGGRPRRRPGGGVHSAHRLWLVAAPASFFAQRPALGGGMLSEPHTPAK